MTTQPDTRRNPSDTGPHPTTSGASALPTSEAEQSRPSLGLSLTQVVGGSLAAVTAAFLGSRLGVAGTLIGTGVASIVSAVGAAVYTASLRRARHAIRTVRTTSPATPGPAALPADVVGTSATVAERGLRTTPTDDGAITVQTRGPIRVNLKRVAIGAAVTFLLAAVAVTCIELLKGSALDGGSGTTISQVRSGSSTSDETPAPSGSVTSDPGATRSTSPSSTATSSGSSSSSSSSSSSTEEPSSSSSSGQTSGSSSTSTDGGAQSTGRGAARVTSTG